MHTFIDNIPKAELHVHLEGTIEPELSFKLAKRNKINIGYNTTEELINAYDFHDLPSFLTIYYAAMNVLLTEDDFYDLTWAYLKKANSENIVYVELFFDPQAHTSRGVPFDMVIKGIRRAQVEAKNTFGIKSQLIMCFLREMSAESAMQHLKMAEPYQNWLVGIGLDSNEKDNPPVKFAEVFAQGRKMGFKLTMHCDVNQKNTHEHIAQCIHDIQLDRIDHGINCLEQEALWTAIKKNKLGLTVCPVSNRFVVQSLTSNEIHAMLEKSLLVTINSDDPAYFRAYLNDNYKALQKEGDFTQEQIVTLVKNAFKVAWINKEEKKSYLSAIDKYVGGYEPM